MKLAIYAIAKNEETNVFDWYNSVKDADTVFVLDTGSTDSTSEKFAELAKTNTNLKVNEASFASFRFDVARNLALQELINYVGDDLDFAVWVDLDERLEEGWRTKLENALKISKETHTNTCNVVNFLVDNGPTMLYNRTAAHVPGKFIWKYPVHEVLVPRFGVIENPIYTDIRVYHKPDVAKQREYLELLHKGLEENKDSRSAYYLGREYSYLGRHDIAVGYLTFAFEEESDRFLRSEIARALAFSTSYTDPESLENLLVYPVLEAPELRESYVDLILFLFNKGEYNGAFYYCKRMMGAEGNVNAPIIRNSSLYVGAWCEHMLGTLCYKLGSVESAKYWLTKALTLEPTNQLIISDMLSVITSEGSNETV